MMDTFFDFLGRRTDFFTGATDDQVELLVLGAMRKASAAAKERAASELAAKAKRAEADRKRKEAKEAEEAAKEGRSQAAPEALSIEEVDETSEKAGKAAAAAADADSDEEEEDKGKIRPNAANGATYSTHNWGQTLTEAEVHVAVPKGTKAKMVSVSIKNKSISIGLKGQPPIVEGELFAKVLPDDSFWTVEDEKEITVTLAKLNGMEWWDKLVLSDTALNVKKIEPENSKLSDLDADTRQTVEKMMFDQRAKAAGTPTSDELQKQEMLRKFQQQHPELDFSQAKFS